MAKEELFKAAQDAAMAKDPYAADWNGDKLLRLMERNMDETASLLDEDFFPPSLVIYIAEKAREATAYTGISSLSKALSRWCLRHKGEREEEEVRPYSEEAEKEAEWVPF